MAGPVNSHSTPTPVPTARPASPGARLSTAQPDPQTAAAFRDRLNRAAERHDPAQRHDSDRDNGETSATDRRDGPQRNTRTDERESRGDGERGDQDGGGLPLAQGPAELAAGRMQAMDAVRGASNLSLDTLARMAAAIAEAAPGLTGAPLTVAFPAQWGMGSGAVLAADAAGRINLTLVGVPAGMAEGAAWAQAASTLRLALRARDVRVGTIRHASDADAATVVAENAEDAAPRPTGRAGNNA